MPGYLAFSSVVLLLLSAVLSLPRPNPAKSMKDCTDQELVDATKRLETYFSAELASSPSSHIPPLNLKIKMFFGSVEYKVFDSKVTQVTFHKSKLVLNPENGHPSWELGLEVTVQGMYSYSHFTGSDRGTYVTVASGVDMLQSDKCHISIQQSNPTFSGATANWGFNSFVKGTSNEDDNSGLKKALCILTRKAMSHVLGSSNCKAKAEEEAKRLEEEERLAKEQERKKEEARRKEELQRKEEERKKEEEDKSMNDSPGFESVPNATTALHEDKFETKEPFIPPTSTTQFVSTMLSTEKKTSTEAHIEKEKEESYDGDLYIPEFMPFAGEKSSSSYAAKTSSASLVFSFIVAILTSSVSLKVFWC